MERGAKAQRWSKSDILNGMEKSPKILIITYYWPPSGGPGVQRWLKMSNYLAQMGCEISVLTLEEDYASYPHLDRNLESDIHPSIDVHRTKAFNPYRILEKLMGKKKMPAANFSRPKNGGTAFNILAFVRSHLFIPDPRRGWNRRAYNSAASLIKQGSFDHIITTSPPHSSQLIGLRLKRRFGIHWVVDFRDPWTDIFYYQHLGHSSFSRGIDSAYEKSVILESDMIFTVGESLAQLLRNKLTRWKANDDVDKVKTITNGYDELDFRGLSKTEDLGVFSIVYTGTLSTLYNYEVVFDALAELAAEGRSFEMKFYGRIPIDVQQDILNRCGEVARFYDEVEHGAINQLQVNADLLLLVLADVPNAEMIVSGKLFEYLRSGVKILNLGPIDGDAAEIITKCSAGKTFNRQQQTDIKGFISECMDVYAAGNSTTSSSKNRQEYSRQSIARRALDMLS